MDRIKVATRLVSIAKGMMAKTYPILLDDPIKNKQLWRDIEDAAETMFANGESSTSLFAEKAKQLARKYGKGQDLDFVFMVREYISEELSSIE